MLSQEILSYIGAGAIIIFVIGILLIILSLVAAYLIFRDKKVLDKIYSTFSSIALKILLFILDFSYFISKKIITLLGGNENMIDIVSIEIRNMLLKKSYSDTPFENRVVLLPQCLRDIDCKTTFSSLKGAQCMSCGNCKIAEIVKKADELGYQGCFIAPGGGFVRRIIKEFKPKAVLGIGCPWEVNTGMVEVSNKGIPVQGVTLLKDGCVQTDVELADVFEVMGYGG